MRQAERAIRSYRVDIAPLMNSSAHAQSAHGRHSAVACCAGFCEIGETLEQAVVRETREEAGSWCTSLE